MTPTKPRITKRRLVWKLNRQRTAWMPYHVTRWTDDNGHRKERAIKLDWKSEPQELDRLFWACEAGRHEKQQKPKSHTWRQCVEAWRSDPKGQGRLAESSRRSYRRAMDKILTKNGDKEMSRTTPKALNAAHGAMSTTPREADRMLQTVSLLWNYAKGKLFWPLGDNPASRIEKFGKQREFEPWPQWMIDKLEMAPASVQTAAALIRGTGQRPSAAISMRRDAFSGEWMMVSDEKGDVTFETYAPDFLRAYVANLPNRGLHILPRNLTQPLGYDAIEKQFRKWRNDLGPAAKPFVLHGLRKLAIIELAEAGATDAEIQAVTGQSAEMVAYYRAKASRKALSRAAQKRRE